MKAAMIDDKRGLLRKAVLPRIASDWYRLGVYGASESRRDRRVLDPEALLMATLRFARWDRGLFDGVLEWLLLNGDLVNVQRLCGLLDDADPRTRSAFVAVSRIVSARPALRLQWKPKSSPYHGEATIFFPLEEPPADPDPDFAAGGFLRARFQPRGLAGEPRMTAPESALLRLRALLGVTLRADILAVLSGGAIADAGAIVRQTGWARRGVFSALESMRRSELLRTLPGRPVRYALAEGFATGAGLLESVWDPALPRYTVLVHLDRALETASLRELDTSNTAALVRRQLNATMLDQLPAFAAAASLPGRELEDPIAYLDSVLASAAAL